MRVRSAQTVDQHSVPRKTAICLQGVRKADVKISMQTNAGDKVLDKEGETLGFQVKVCCNPGGKVNMFGFCNVTDQHRIAHDNKIEDAFVAHMDEGKIKFFRNHEGSHGCNFPNDCKEEAKQANMKTGQQHLETAAENRRICSASQFE